MKIMRFQPLASCKKMRRGVILLLAVAVTGCGSIIPYSDEFQCPGNYRGLCESPVDAYKDSINGIEPHKFNKEWQEDRKAWEENNPELLAARSKLSKFNNASASDNPAGYRELLFLRMRDQVESPVVPELSPPETVRCLILDSLGRKDGSLYTPPHYVHFIMEQPRWNMKKIPELQAHNQFDPKKENEGEYNALFAPPPAKPGNPDFPSQVIDPGGNVPGVAQEQKPVARSQPFSPVRESPEMGVIRQFVNEEEGVKKGAQTVD